jgi:hypothetical protein
MKLKAKKVFYVPESSWPHQTGVSVWTKLGGPPQSQGAGTLLRGSERTGVWKDIRCPNGRSRGKAFSTVVVAFILVLVTIESLMLVKLNYQ